MRKSYTCDDCIWKDKCNSEAECEDIVLHQLNDEEVIGSYIESKRIEFRREWYEYIDEWN